MGRKSRTVFLLAVILCTTLWAQRPPVIRPPELPAGGGGIPTPPWLGRGRTVTGHIAGIDPDRILVRSFDYGNVLFFVDEKTVVRVEKHRLSLSDLQEGDPVAVHLKEIKGKGPYATEILPHPEVWRRKEQGGAQKPAAESHGNDDPTLNESVSSAGLPASEKKPAAAAAATSRLPPFGATTAAEDLPEPALPAGERGFTGTITEVQGDQATVVARNGKSRKVLVTSVTRIVRAGTDQPLAEVRAGDRVAVVGDTLDTGVVVAREILVNRSAAVAAASASAGQGAQPASAGELSGDFVGTIVALEADSIRVRMPEGRERVVLVTGVTNFRRWGVDVPFNTLRKGDEVTVSGDVLEGGVTVAREVNVTKPVSSR